MLYAQDRWAVLLIFQAMDAAGKDGAIKHVMSGVNPQGCQVASFKAPSAEDLDHDYLWRCQKHLPERGRIGIFNRSYYEEMLVVRVHPELLERQKLPTRAAQQAHLGRALPGDPRLRALPDGATAWWCGSSSCTSRGGSRSVASSSASSSRTRTGSSRQADARERRHWKNYMRAYEDTIRSTATEEAPWYVVPADNKWFTRVVVAAAVIDALASLDLHYPRVDPEKLAELARVKRALRAER